MRLSLIILPLLLIGATAPNGRVNGPIAVELFTSQGCSSCPPADAFAEELAKRSDVVVLTRPVTYWDRLGWRDTLGREENTALQRAYAARAFDDEGVYTPQMVIAGRFGEIGSEKQRVFARIESARRATTAAIVVRPDHIGIGGSGGPAEVKLLSLRSSVPVRIGSGENGGRMIRYSNVVIAEQVIGRWNGSAARFDLPKEMRKGTDRRAIVLQKAGGGPILAAAYL